MRPFAVPQRTCKESVVTGFKAVPFAKAHTNVVFAGGVMRYVVISSLQTLALPVILRGVGTRPILTEKQAVSLKPQAFCAFTHTCEVVAFAFQVVVI